MTILIVEDNLQDKREIVNAVSKFNCRNETVYIETMNEVPADGNLEKFSKVDCAFIDIEMPGTDGIEFARILRKYSSRIELVFVSWHSEYIRECVDLHIANFIEKPVDVKKVRDTLEYVSRRVSITNSTRQVINVRYGIRLEKVERILPEEIFSIHGHGTYVSITTYEGERKLLASYKEIAYQLPDYIFFECSNGVVINLSKIKYYDEHVVELTNGQKFKIGKVQRNRLDELERENRL